MPKKNKTESVDEYIFDEEDDQDETILNNEEEEGFD